MRNRQTFPTESELEIIRVIGASDRPIYGSLIHRRSKGRVNRVGLYSQILRLQDRRLIRIATISKILPGKLNPLYELTEKGRVIYQAARDLEALDQYQKPCGESKTKPDQPARGEPTHGR